MNTFKNHWAVFGFDVDSLEVGQGPDSRVFTAVGNIDELDLLQLESVAGNDNLVIVC